MSTTKVDEQELRDALSHGNIPILLMVLVQLTGDLRWMPIRYVRIDNTHREG